MPQVLSNLDLARNELQNVRIQNLASAPATPAEGQVYYNTTDKKFYLWNGSAWIDATGAVKSVNATAPLSSTGGDTPTISVAVGTSAGTVAAGNDARFPTSDQKAALAGTSGTPSSTNKFVTNSDSRLTDARTPTSHDLVDSAKHPVSGLTTGHFLKALSATTYGFTAHGLTKSDVGLSNVENKSSATIRSEITSSNVTSALGFTPENAANKGQSNGYAGLDSNGKIPLAQLPDAAKNQTFVVANPAERNALTNLLSGDKAYETSTGDSYIWDGSSWRILADADWENVNLDWANINGKPTSSVANIDDAVSKRHSHSNKSTLDAITSAGSGSIITAAERTKLSGIAEGANNYVHPSDGGGSRSGLSGATVISGITVNTAGHVTGTTVRDMTAADLGAAKKYATTIGDGSSTAIAVTHNLGTRDVVVMVAQSGTPYAQVFCDVEMTTTNTITLRFASAPASGAYRVTVIG